jgi:hypothetical protein
MRPIAEVLNLPIRAVSSQPVSTVCNSLLDKAGYRPINPAKEALATAAVAILFGSYRKDEVAAVEIFREAMAATLADYPDDCIRYVTDPRTGVQSYNYTIVERDRNGGEREVKGKFKSWPPNPGELQEACERYIQPIRARAAREQRERECEQERKREAALPPKPYRGMNELYADECGRLFDAVGPARLLVNGKERLS